MTQNKSWISTLGILKWLNNCQNCSNTTNTTRKSRFATWNYSMILCLSTKKRKKSTCIITWRKFWRFRKVWKRCKPLTKWRKQRIYRSWAFWRNSTYQPKIKNSMILSNWMINPTTLRKLFFTLTGFLAFLDPKPSVKSIKAINFSITKLPFKSLKYPKVQL